MKKNIVIILVIVLLIAIGVGLFFFINSNNSKTETAKHSETTSPDTNQEVVEEEPAEPVIEIFNGDARPMAFMIDNNKNAQPQSALNSAYMVYEIIVEGGETRLMALFKGVTIDQIGPIRSARHYFLDYAMENDALYAHLGYSPQAERDFSVYGINNISGQAYDTGKARTETAKFWRATHKKAPHNAYTNTNAILQVAADKGYATTSTQESVLNYVADEVTLEAENAIVANTVTIPYATNHTVQYTYDATTQRYTRHSKGKLMSDELTGEAVTTKNLIITFANNYTLNDGENKGRQDVVTTGELDGYYITNGKAIPIKCIKPTRRDQTTYQDLNGNEINVNDGNTWVNVCPINASVTIQ